MKTKIWNVLEQPNAIIEAAQWIQKGRTIAFPTETVYGLGADATNKQAVNKIFEAKNRPQDNPLIVHVPTKDDLVKVVKEIPSYVEALMDRYTPGPLTFVLKENGVCASNVTKGLSTIAVRIPDHPIALEFLKQCNLPIAAPSANRSGKPSPTSAQHVLEDLNGRIAGILDGGTTPLGVESTVIDCTDDIPLILRPGGITLEQIKEVTSEVHLLKEKNQEHEVRSPGMKYKHYAPDVPLWIVEGSSRKLQETIDAYAHNYRITVIGTKKTLRAIHANQVIPLGDDPKEIATHLYDALRLCNSDETDLILCEALPKRGLGHTLMNRLEKAATRYIQ